MPRNWAQQVAPYIDILGKRVPEPGTTRPAATATPCASAPSPCTGAACRAASYSESVSWGKIVPAAEGGRWAEVPVDATIAWPLVVKAVMERMDK